MNGLDRGFINDNEMAELQGEMNQLFKQHQNDLSKSSQARDYQMLYHHYLRKGEIERAWNFRIQASKTLANSSDRAMFQRQADVIAVLYNSNFAIDRAKKYLDRAGAIYQGEGSRDQFEQTRDLEQLIY